MYNRILVSIADSETMDSLLQDVEWIAAENSDCRFTLFHVLIPLHNNIGAAIGFPVDAGEVQARLEQEGHEILHEARHRLMTVGIEPRTILKWGDPADEICRYAESEQIDLTIVGSKDKGLLDKLLFSSVSQKVVQDAPSRVLVVK
jgi:nucleotide-binding universal stress UspA family protein